MGIFFQKVVLYLPREIDAEPIGELNLVKRFRKQPLLGAVFPRPR